MMAGLKQSAPRAGAGGVQLGGSAVLDIALAFPTVVFTVLLLVTAGYWLLTLAGGLDLGDADPDFDVDGGETGDDGVVESLVGRLHPTEVPPVVVLSLVNVFGWLTCYLVALLTGLGEASTVARAVGGSALIGGSVVVGVLVSAVAARPLARLFQSSTADRSADLVGRVCEVRTLQVLPTYGQARVQAPGGGEVTVQVRCAQPNALTAGATALLVDYDAAAGVFWVSPLTDTEVRTITGPDIITEGDPS
jgi:hypothetical protein